MRHEDDAREVEDASRVGEARRDPPRAATDLLREAEYAEGYKGIARLIGRCEKTVRDLAKRRVNPLPIFRVGGVYRLTTPDYERWLGLERQLSAQPAQAPRVVEMTLDELERTILDVVIDAMPVATTTEAREIAGRVRHRILTR